MWTLEHAGTEQTLESWGLGTDLVLHRSNQAIDVLTVSSPGLMDAALVFAYGDAVIVRRDRTGSATSWSGGSIYFQGKATLPQRYGSGTAERLKYKFQGPWWDFQRVVYQQIWRNYYGHTSAPSGTVGVDWVSDTIRGMLTYFTLQRSSELFLGQDRDGTRLTTGDQITEAVNWAISCGVNCQLGTIDPAVNIVTYPCRDITVAEVLVQMLRWSPDCVSWFDYTTTPPTLNVRTLANLDSVTITPPTDKVRDLSLVPRYDLQLPAVILRFKTVHTTTGAGGGSWVQISTQKYPTGATGFELGASVHTIELGGSSVARTICQVTLADVAAQSSTEADRIAWWKNKNQLLNGTKIDSSSLHITSGTVKDEAGGTVSLVDFPREIVDGTLADWTGYTGVTVKVEAIAIYDLYADDAHLILVEKGRQLTINVRVKLTDAEVTAVDGVTGVYATLTDAVSAESEPTGLAQSLYTSLSPLQHEGQFSLVGTEVPTGLALGNKLTIAGLDLTLEDLLIQQVTEEPHEGRITLSVGPAAHLGVADLIELLRVNRYRNTISSGPRTTGEAGGGEVIPGQTGARENTVSGNGETGMHTANVSDGSNTAVAAVQAVKPDATPDPAIVLQRVVTATGAAANNSHSNPAARVDLRLSDLPTNPDNTDPQVKWRNWGTSSNPIYVASSGVGSGLAVQYKVQSVSNEYVTAKTWDGTTLGSTAVNIAKPWALRVSNKPATTDGSAAPFVAMPTLLSGTFALALKVMPEYAANDIIYAEPCDFSGVTVSSLDLKLIEVAPGRAWALDWHTMGLDIRETQGCDPTTGTPVYAYFLRGTWHGTALTGSYGT